MFDDKLKKKQWLEMRQNKCDGLKFLLNLSLRD